MTDYPFDNILAVDASGPELLGGLPVIRVASNALVTVFDINDATKTPVALKTIDGLPIPNPVQVNALGMGPAPVAQVWQLGWEGGGLSGTFTSNRGLRDETVAAVEAAQGAQLAAENAASTAGAEAAAAASAALAGAAADAESARADAEAAAALVGAPADTAMAAAASNSSSQFRGALNATFGAQIDAAVPAAVVDVISNDPTVASNAAALAQSDAGLARKADPGMPGTVATDRDSEWVSATVDVAGNVTEAINNAGVRVLPRADLAGALVEQYASDEYLKGSVDSAGNVAEDVIGRDGRVPAWVLTEWQKRMGISDASYPYDIVIVAGQSNATQRGSLPVTVSNPDSRIQQWNYLTGKIEAVAETDVQWLGNEFAREYVKNVPNRRVLIVPTAWGETGFRTTSLASPPAGYVTKPNGTWDRTLTTDPKNLYAQMISKAQAARTAAGAGARVVALLWSQGESDRGLLTESTYAAALDDLIASARTDLGLPALPVVIGSMIPETINYGPTNYYDITKALLDTPRRVKSTSYVWGPANYAEYPELIHWNPQGQSVRAKIMANDGLYRAKLNVVTAIPQQPLGLRISRSGTAVEIKWDAPPTRVTAYTLEISTDSGATWTPQTLAGPIVTEYSTTIATNLPVWARAKTTNEVGTSDYSREAKA